jgi:hypothetical protein
MSLETTMGALAYAKKLRAHQKTLKAKHTRDLRAYAVAFEAWKKSLEAWLKSGAIENVRKLTRGSVSASRYAADTAILRGHPTAPTKPSTDAIDRISGVLRHLAITGQKSVRVSSSDVERYFGDDAESDE